jgi:S-(hydroxymethyl)glutathione dehydrogenase / alcohol dehydrogenase
MKVMARAKPACVARYAKQTGDGYSCGRPWPALFGYPTAVRHSDIVLKTPVDHTGVIYCGPAKVTLTMVTSGSVRKVVAPVLRAPGVSMELEEISLLPPREGEVMVRLVASGVCHSCLHWTDGTHRGSPLPIILGDEGSGVVEEIGPDVSGLAVGDHVVLSWAPGCGVCKQCLRGRPALCTKKPAVGLMDDGTTRFRRGDDAIYHLGPSTFSPYSVVAARAAIKVDRSVPLRTAALIGCAVSTGAGAIIHTAEVKCGQSVAVVGCGGIGLNAIYAAGLCGAHPIVAVDPLISKLDAARRLGATETIRLSGAGVGETVRSVTDGGADVVVVAVGDTLAIEQGVEALAPGGKCVVVGAPPSGEVLTIDPHQLRAQEKVLMGCSYGSCNPPVDFPMFTSLYRAGRFALDEFISRTYELSEVNEALINLADGKDLRGVIVFDSCTSEMVP